MNKLIAFTGPIGSGKTTAAKELYTLGFQIIRFAGPLKAMLRCLGLTEEHTDGRWKEEPIPLLGYKTPRYAMQTLGTEWGRDLICKDLWINVWREAVERNRKFSPIVVDDVRFENEVQAVRQLDGIVIFIDRPNKTWERHLSERFAFTPDLVLYNHSTEKEFLSRVRELKK